MEGIPQESEFNVKNVQKMIENDEEVLLYLPNYTEKHRPDKQFLLNIVNTVH